MDEAAPVGNIRGTRPFEAMVPSKPWTSEFLTVDDVTARQSRIGQNSARYRDGRLRADRPRPPAGAVPELSPRNPQPYKRPDHPIYWETSGRTMAETSTKAGYGERPGLVGVALSTPTRHMLSPRYSKSTVGQIIFADTNNYMVRPDVPLIPKVSPFSEAFSAAAASPRGTLEPTEERRVMALEALVRHEKRMADYARARYVSELRKGVQQMT